MESVSDSAYAVDDTSIVCDVDSKSRQRMRVRPRRNNSNINATAVSPLYTIALGGNVDMQYISNERGAAEYCACYTSKAEAPDSATLQLILTKYYSRMQAEGTTSIPLREHLKAVGNAVINSTSVGATQAIWVLLKLPFVMFSRSVLSVNALPKGQVRSSVIIDEDVLDVLHDNDSAITMGCSSQLGRRLSYLLFVNRQLEKFGKCCVSFFSLLTHFGFTRSDQITNATPKLLRQNDVLIEMPENGSLRLDSKYKSFRISDIVFTRYQKERVISLNPYCSIDGSSERSAFTTLLMHLPWGPHGEDGLLTVDGVQYATAVEALHAAIDKDLFPAYVKPMLSNVRTSEQLLREAGNVHPSREDLPDQDNASNPDDNNS